MPSAFAATALSLILLRLLSLLLVLLLSLLSLLLFLLLPAPLLREIVDHAVRSNRKSRSRRPRKRRSRLRIRVRAAVANANPLLRWKPPMKNGSGSACGISSKYAILRVSSTMR